MSPAQFFPPLDEADPPQLMRHRFARIGPLAWLATSPDTSTATGAFGNAVLNMAWSFYMARHTGAKLCVVPTDPSRYGALCRLRCRDVPMVAPESCPAHMMAAVLRVARATRSPLRRIGLNPVSVDGPAEPPATGPRALYHPFFGLNFRRLFVEQPLQVTLGFEDAGDTEALAAALSLKGGRRIVTLHVRESGFKAAQGISDRDKDVVRNACVHSYAPAIDWLVERGFLVVRIGDSSMTPMSRPGVMDLATSPRRTLALELWCIQRSAFFIATDSGPYNLCLLFNVPCLATNMTHVIGGVPAPFGRQVHPASRR